MEFQSDPYILWPICPELNLSGGRTEQIFNVHH